MTVDLEEEGRRRSRLALTREEGPSATGLVSKVPGAHLFSGPP
jgi:hypothetical protein